MMEIQNGRLQAAIRREQAGAELWIWREMYMNGFRTGGHKIIMHHLRKKILKALNPALLRLEKADPGMTLAGMSVQVIEKDFHLHPHECIGLASDVSYLHINPEDKKVFLKLLSLALDTILILPQDLSLKSLAGQDLGKLQAEYDNDLWVSRSDVNLTRFFIQPTLGITSKVIDFGISTRLVGVNMVQESINNAGFLLEPAATLKLGWDHFKAVAQVGASAPLNKDVEFNYQPFLISLGIQLNFGKIFQ